MKAIHGRQDVGRGPGEGGYAAARSDAATQRRLGKMFVQKQDDPSSHTNAHTATFQTRV